MSVRKNAKFLSATEREAFVKACVLMKADIVNPGAPAAQQYSRWDENTAIHQMIQSAFAPGAPSVNFGHGGSGAYAFFSWHRFFLHVVEQQLQTYVPGVLIPYWDWTDPTSIMTDTFLGPNGASGTGPRAAGRPAGRGRPGDPTGLRCRLPVGAVHPDPWCLDRGRRVTGIRPSVAGRASAGPSGRGPG
jgi:hypothetical protein